LGGATFLTHTVVLADIVFMKWLISEAQTGMISWHLSVLLSVLTNAFVERTFVRLRRVMYSDICAVYKYELCEVHCGCYCNSRRARVLRGAVTIGGHSAAWNQRTYSTLLTALLSACAPTWFTIWSSKIVILVIWPQWLLPVTWLKSVWKGIEIWNDINVHK